LLACSQCADPSPSFAIIGIGTFCSLTSFCC
jgi:hypothetical protein